MAIARMSTPEAAFTFKMSLALAPSQAGVITTYTTVGDWTTALNQTPFTIDLNNPTSTTSTDIVIVQFFDELLHPIAP